MGKFSTKFGEVFKGISLGNVKGLCILFVCLFGALALVLVPVLTSNAGAGNNNAGLGGGGGSDTGTEEPGPNQQIYVYAWSLIANITMNVDEIESDVLIIQDVRAVVSIDVIYGDEFVFVELGDRLLLTGLVQGNAKISVTVRTRTSDSVVEEITRYSRITIA